MDRDPRLRVVLLGGFRVSRGAADRPVPGARLRGLAVRLALAGGRPVPPGVLAGAIWAEEPPADPAHALQALVSRLRRTLGAATAVVPAAGGYRLEVAADDVDALRFERLAAAGRDRLRAGDPAGAAAALGEAVTLWGDRPGAEPAVVAAVAPGAATRLAHTSVEAVADLAAAELALGRAEAAATRLTALLAEHPVHERAAALLMDALAAQGRQADALARYEQTRRALADVLGADPGSALHERHLRLLRAAPAAEAGPGPTDSLAAPTDPPTPTGLATPIGLAPPIGRLAPVGLPAPLTSFLGRDDDLARVGARLATGRLVTVLGPGGAGKTRLAVEAARRHRHEYRDGAWLIDLAPVTEPAKVGAAVLAGAGLRGDAKSAGRAELDVLADQLGARETLLLVDNCEHLIDAVAHLVAALLPRCPGLRILATSREPLAVDGEALVPLGPLPLPEVDDDVAQARQAAAVRLFVERAAAVRPGFDLDEATLPGIRQVVRSLDGMPLALELAAARLRTMSLDELAAGLSDRFRLLTTGNRTALPRHRTLRAVIAWSWDLLSAAERTVAERISILPGGVTPASATAVCAGTAVPPEEIPALLAALVDRSLLQLAPDPGRYRMLETLREYGISTGDADTARDLAAGYFAGLIGRCARELHGPGQPAALRLIAADYDNALAALRHFRDPGAALRLALNLAWYWQMVGRQADAAYWLGRALDVPGGRPSVERDCAEAIARPGPAVAERLAAAPALPGPWAALAAVTLAFGGEEQAALTVLDRLAGGDEAGVARLFRAEVAENAGELDRMRPDVAAALDIFRAAGDRWGLATALPLRAQLRQYDGDLEGALADLREARSLAGEFGSLSLADEVFGELRWIDLHLRRDDTEAAIAAIGSARAKALRAASTAMPALVDAREADLRVRIGDLDRARELLDDAERGLAGAATFPGDHVRALIGSVRAALCLRRGDPAGAGRMLTRAYAAALATGDRPILALVAADAATLAGARGRHREAAVLLGAAARLRGAHDRTDRRIREVTERGRGAIGPAAFAAAYGRGWELDGRTAVTRVDPAVTVS